MVLRVIPFTPGVCSDDCPPPAQCMTEADYDALYAAAMSLVADYLRRERDEAAWQRGISVIYDGI